MTYFLSVSFSLIIYRSCLSIFNSLQNVCSLHSFQCPNYYIKSFHLNLEIIWNHLSIDKAKSLFYKTHMKGRYAKIFLNKEKHEFKKYPYLCFEPDFNLIELNS